MRIKLTETQIESLLDAVAKMEGGESLDMTSTGLSMMFTAALVNMRRTKQPAMFVYGEEPGDGE